MGAIFVFQSVQQVLNLDKIGFKSLGFPGPYARTGEKTRGRFVG